MLVNVSKSLPDRIRSFLDQRDVDLAVSDYLVGVADEVASDLMDFEEFVDVVSTVRTSAVVDFMSKLRCFSVASVYDPPRIYLIPKYFAACLRHVSEDGLLYACKDSSLLGQAALPSAWTTPCQRVEPAGFAYDERCGIV
jgi:hypothetical protein